MTIRAYLLRGSFRRNGINLAWTLSVLMQFYCISSALAARPISEDFTAADVVVVASIGNFSQDPNFQTGLVERGGITFVGSAQDEAMIELVRPPGAYEVKILTTLKGDGANLQNIHLPVVSYYYYGQNKFELPIGAVVLLSMKADPNGNMMPVDRYIPLVPLSSDATTELLSRGNNHFDLVDLLSASLDKPEFRKVLAFLIRDSPDQRIYEKMKNYSAEKDVELRSYSLYCMALHQDVSVIPKIAQMAAESEKAKTGNVPVDALQFFKNKEAVPYLNPLIVEGTDHVRLNAMMALRPIADDSSVPFLINALDKDDSQHSVAYGAYYALHRIIGPSLPPALSMPQFYAHKDEEIQPLKQWWEWEQLKAKKAAATSTSPATQSSPSPSGLKVP
jgi:hypothetical protein